MNRDDLLWIFDRLLDRYGPQHWWPAETPFEVMVGAVLTQNTAWSNVERAIGNLKQSACLDCARLAAISLPELAAMIRPAGYFNIKAQRLQNLCRFLLHSGGEGKLAAYRTADLRHALLSVNGVGPETADDILLYAFERPVFVIDAYTRRLFHALGRISGEESYETLRADFETALGPDAHCYNEYHALIVMHAKIHCRKRPVCEGCPLNERCEQGRAHVDATEHTAQG